MSHKRPGVDAATSRTHRISVEDALSVSSNANVAVSSASGHCLSPAAEHLLLVARGVLRFRGEAR